MVDMERREMNKSDSCGLVQNLQEMDQNIKQILKLVREDSDSLSKNVEAYCEEKPELIEEFHRMYRSLAGCYGQLTKEAHKMIPSVIPDQGFGDSESGVAHGSPLWTPDAKLGLHKSGHKLVGLDMSPSSDGSSPDFSLKNGSESSSSSSLGSESESLNSPVSNYLVPPLNDEFDSQGWQNKITELETELSSVKDKLEMKESDLQVEKILVFELQKQLAELENRASDTDNEIGRLVGELEVTKESLKGSDQEVAKLRSELTDKMVKGIELAQEDIAMLEDQVALERKYASELQEWIVRSNADILDRDHEVMELKTALHDAQEQFSREKAHLKADISSLSEKQAILEARVEEWGLLNNNLDDELKQCRNDKIEMEAREMALQDEISRLKLEVSERNEYMEAVNKDFDGFKLKYDVLMAEKDELNAKVQVLMADLSSRDSKILETEGHVFRLQTEHEDLTVETENAGKLVDELKLRVEDLQKELRMLRIVISDAAEEKREAIRQLCFTLEHYRSGYKQLRQAFTGQRRRAVAAA